MLLNFKLLIFLLLFISSQTIATQPSVIKIGVLSHRGDIATEINWSNTAEFLSRKLPGYHFKIVPLDFAGISLKIKNRDIDFLLVNPSIYVEMEVLHRISRIATLSRMVKGKRQNEFAGVLFTTRARQDIQDLDDIRGKRLAAVDRNSLGGFQMVARELADQGIEIENDLKLSFFGTHDEVVKFVIEGTADIGTVRSGILESMNESGQIDLSKIRILNQHINDHFNQLHSTRLYPEWPFSKLPHTSDELAQKVAIALMEMPSLTMRNGQNTMTISWSIPREYQPVHEILQTLRLPPYDLVTRFTITDAIKKYWYVILSTFIIFSLLTIIIFLVIRLNSTLKKYNQRLERQYALILDSVADGIYGVDLDGNSTFVNKSMERITGWNAESMIGRNQHSLLHHTHANGERHLEEECPVYRTFKDEKSRYIEDDFFWRKDGSSFPVEYSSTPLKDEQNQTIGSVVIFRDISERKKAEEQARKFRHELAHIARVSTMGEMASGMAHELNQPLTAISAYADACIRLIDSSKFDTDNLSDTLEQISLQAKRSGAIIQQLRNFVRKDIPQKNQVNINEIIKEVLVLIRQKLDENAIHLNLQIEQNLPFVRAQHIQIDQVILNLANNAIESMATHSSGKKILIIKTELADEKNVKVSIADSGPGIDANILKILFNPFNTSKKTGMGLGLSISKGIIEEHGGKLYLEHSSENGAVFKFSLPVITEG